MNARIQRWIRQSILAATCIGFSACDQLSSLTSRVSDPAMTSPTPLPGGWTYAQPEGQIASADPSGLGAQSYYPYYTAPAEGTAPSAAPATYPGTYYPTYDSGKSAGTQNYAIPPSSMSYSASSAVYDPASGASTAAYNAAPYQHAAGATTAAYQPMSYYSTDGVTQWTPTAVEQKAALSEYGTWSATPAYGEVWVPANMPPGWRPYLDGQWINSDAGWLWQANEPWGWLPYHYGHWVFLPRLGWAWVRGSVWVPSQVAWRVSHQHVAWAPLPPAAIRIDAIPANIWVVVPSARFLEPRLMVHALPPAQVNTVLLQTPVVAVNRYFGPRMVYAGPDVVVVSRWGRPPPRPVAVNTWCNQVPTHYKVHYDNGRHRGWYKPVKVAAQPAANVSVEHRAGKTEVDVNRRGPAPDVEVEATRRGPGRRLEVEREGPRGREVEVTRHGRRRTVEVERANGTETRRTNRTVHGND